MAAEFLFLDWSDCVKVVGMIPPHLQSSESFVRGFSLVQRERFKEAHECFKSLFRLDYRTGLDTLSVLYQYYESCHQPLALTALIVELLIDAKRYQEAFWELADLFDTDPQYTPTYFLLSKLYQKQVEKAEIRRIFALAFEKGVYDSTILDLLPTMYLEVEDYDQSVRFYETLVQQRPEVVHLKKSLAGLYEQAKRYEEACVLMEAISQQSPSSMTEAAAFCEQCCAKDPDNPVIRQILVGLHTRSCNPVGAVTHLQQIVERQPDYIQEAAQACKQLLDLYPDTVDVLIELAKLLVQMGRFSEAVHCLRQIFDHGRLHPEWLPLIHAILNQYPNQVMALQLMADFSFRHGDYAMTLDRVDALLPLSDWEGEGFRAEPLLVAIMVQSHQFAPRARLVLVRLLNRQKDYARAEAEARRLLGTPLELEGRLCLMEALKGLNRELDLEVQLKAALEKFPHSAEVDAALKDLALAQIHAKTAGHSDDKDHALDLGMRHFLSEDFVSAQLYFQKLDDHHPQYWDAQIMLGLCWLESGKFDLAMPHFSRLLADQPTQSLWSAPLRQMLGVSALHFGLRAEAEGYLHLPPLPDSASKFLTLLGPGRIPLVVTAMVEGPEGETLNFAAAHNSLGVEHVIRGHFKVAEEAFQLALDLDPDSPEIPLNQGVLSVMNAMATLPEVLVQFQAILERWPTLNMAHLNVGILYAMGEDFESALTHLSKALSLTPDFPIAALILGDVHAAKGQLREALSYWALAAKSKQFFYAVQRRTWYRQARNWSASNWIAASLHFE